MDRIIYIVIVILTLFVIVIMSSVLTGISQLSVNVFSALVGATAAFYAVFVNNERTDIRSEKDRKNAILLASLDKRLMAHQQAYAHLRKLFKLSYADWEGGKRRADLISARVSAEEWWDNNNLFLTQDASKAFHLYIFDVVVFNREEVSEDSREKLEQLLLSASRAITQGVEVYNNSDLIKDSV